MTFYFQKNIVNRLLASHLKTEEKVTSVKLLKRNPRGARSRVTLLYQTNKNREFVGKELSTKFFKDKLFYTLKYIDHYAEQKIAPHVLLKDKQKNFIICEKIHGSVLFDEIKRGLLLSSFKKAIQDSAKTLALLHNIPIKLELERILGLRARYHTTYDPNKFFRLTTFVDSHFDKRFEKLKEKTYKLSDILDKKAAQFLDFMDVTKECFVHNDYHPEHIVYNKNFKTKIIDFDLASVGDYFWDLGRLIFKIEILQYLFYDKKIIDKELTNLFLEEYLKHIKIEIHSKKILEELLNVVRADGIRIYLLVCFKEKKEHYVDEITYEKTPAEFYKKLDFYLNYFSCLIKKINAAIPKRTAIY
jgi:thiamine kinase-like enzyme